MKKISLISIGNTEEISSPDYKHIVIDHVKNIPWDKLPDIYPVVFEFKKRIDTHEVNQLVEKLFLTRIGTEPNNHIRRYILNVEKAADVLKLLSMKSEIRDLWNVDILEILELKHYDFKTLTSVKILSKDQFIRNISFNISKDNRHGLSNKWGAINLARSLGVGYKNPDSDKMLLQFNLCTIDKINFQSILKSLKNDKDLKDFEHVQNATNIRELFLFGEDEKIKLLDDQGFIWERPFAELLGVGVDVDDNLEAEKEYSCFSLVFWDLRFKNDDIEESFKELKKFKVTNPGIPVIVFTASNKAWNREKAIQYGADGYWLKEGISDEPEDVMTNWVNNLKTLFLVKSRYDVLRLYWTAIEQIIVRKSGIKIFEETRNVKNKGFKSTKFEKRISERLNMFYGLLKSGYEQTEYNKESFALSDWELGYMTLWSSLVEISEMYFEKNQPNASVEVEGEIKINHPNSKAIKYRSYLNGSCDYRWKLKGLDSNFIEYNYSSNGETTNSNYYRIKSEEVSNYSIDGNSGEVNENISYVSNSKSISNQICYIISCHENYKGSEKALAFLKSVKDQNKIRNSLYLTHGGSLTDGFFDKTVFEKRKETKYKITPHEGDAIYELFNLIAFLLTGRDNIMD